MDKPTSPLCKESRLITVNRAAKNVIRLPTNSRWIASHLKWSKAKWELKELSLYHPINIQHSQQLVRILNTYTYINCWERTVETTSPKLEQYPLPICVQEISAFHLSISSWARAILYLLFLLIERDSTYSLTFSAQGSLDPTESRDVTHPRLWADNDPSDSGFARSTRQETMERGCERAFHQDNQQFEFHLKKNFC